MSITAPAAPAVNVAGLRERLRRLDDAWTPVPGLKGHWASTQALTGGSAHTIPDDVEVLLEHGLLRWSSGPAGHGLVWQRTPAGTRWMRGATQRLPKAPALRSAVAAGHGPHSSVVRVTHPSGTGRLAIVVDRGEHELWWARDTMSHGHSAESPRSALADFAERAAADAAARRDAIQTAAGGDDRLRELADEAVRILKDRGRLLAHVLANADELGGAVLASTSERRNP